jgi:hypothetical protein
MITHYQRSKIEDENENEDDRVSTITRISVLTRHLSW